MPSKKATKEQAKAKGKAKASTQRKRKKGATKKRGKPKGRKEVKRNSPDCGPFSNMETLEQAKQVADLKLEGKSWRAIGEALDIHHSTAQECFWKLMGWTEGDAQEAAREVREVESARLEMLFHEALSLARDGTSIQGPDGVVHEDAGSRVRALETARKISESKRKLFGVDQPDKHEHMGKDGAALLLAGEIADLSDEDLDRELAGFTVGVAAGEDRERKRQQVRKRRSAPEPEPQAQAEEEADPEARGEAPQIDPSEAAGASSARGKSPY